ncbi:ATP-binding protein [Acrocarpospora sp. B8E8]|uniref:ATP-binding protein n=1 Tax=Acrocarpospora sp. B8E8 TaxID=3153572 RepID=UPI00325F6048
MAKAEEIDQSSATSDTDETPCVRWGSIELPGTPSATSKARAFVREVFERRADERVHDMLILATELFSNAVRHSDSGWDPDGKIRLQITELAGILHLQVVDQGSARTVPYLISKPGEEGYGLQLVEKISSEWGHCYCGEGGRTVWANLAPPGESSAWPELEQGTVAPGEVAASDDAGPEESEKESGPARPTTSQQVVHVAAVLARRMRSGQVTPGSRVATQQQLMEEHGVSRQVAWSALCLLRIEGYAYFRKNVGTISTEGYYWPSDESFLFDELVEHGFNA